MTWGQCVEHYGAGEVYQPLLEALTRLCRRRAHLHRRVGAREEAAYGDRVAEIAAELALHFEQGRDHGQAILYLQHTGETDRRRSAYQEAQMHFGRALALLGSLPASRERDEREVMLRIGLGGILMATRGWGAPAVGATYARLKTSMKSGLE